MNRPTYYIETKWERVIGMKYEQPIERLNGKSYFEYQESSYERKSLGKLYWESRAYNDTIVYCKFNSNLWSNVKAKNQAFEKIYEFIKNGKSGTGSSVTELMPFEIFLLFSGK